MTKLICPACNDRTVSLFKVMLADLFGWAVRCPGCKKRFSHARYAGSLFAVLIFLAIGLIVTYVGVQVTLRANYSGNIILGICAGLICAILILTWFLPLIKREEISNIEVIRNSRRVISWTLWSWGIILVASVASTWGSITALGQSGIIPTCVAMIIFVVLMIYRNWTI